MTTDEHHDAIADCFNIQMVEIHRLMSIIQAVQDLVLEVDDSDTNMELHNTLGQISDVTSA